MFLISYLPFYNFILKLFGYKTNNKEETIYFDLETTGLNPYHNKIIEYAFICEEHEVDNIETTDNMRDKINETNYMNSSEDIDNEYSNDNYITSLVNPETKFDRKITNITNIHPDQLEDKPTIDKCLLDITHFINYDSDKYSKTSYLVAHNCDSFDKIFLKNAITNYQDTTNTELDTQNWKYIDTVLFAKKLYPNLFSYSLKNLSNLFKIKDGDHRALNDAKCLQKVYHNLLLKLTNKIDKTYDSLIENPSIVYDYIYN
jgi:DNA polymerase III epsilon subunit-like protein